MRPTSCLHFARRTTSLRLGGQAARPSCLAAWPASRRQRSCRHCDRHTHSDAYPTQKAPVSLSVTPPHQTQQNCPVLVMCGGVNWTIAVTFKLQIFCRRQSWVVENIQFTPPRQTRHRQNCFVGSGVAVWIGCNWHNSRAGLTGCRTWWCADLLVTYRSLTPNCLWSTPSHTHTHAYTPYSPLGQCQPTSLLLLGRIACIFQRAEVDRKHKTVGGSSPLLTAGPDSAGGRPAAQLNCGSLDGRL